MATLLTWPMLQQQSAAGGAISATSLTSSGLMQPLLPAGVLQPGAMIRLGATGEVTSSSATPTLTLGFYLVTPGGSVAFGTAIAVTAALPISASAAAWPFIMKYKGTFRAVGASGTLHGQGTCEYGANSGLGSAMSIYPLPITQAARTVTSLVLNNDQCFDVGVLLSSATGSPAVTITDLWGEIAG